MEIACSACTYQTIGPPTLVGTSCPECVDGELGAVRPAPLEDVLAVGGWIEAFADPERPVFFFTHEVSFESFECAEARRSIIRENEAHMLAAIRQGVAFSFVATGDAP